jgi:hypothetical protein
MLAVAPATPAAALGDLGQPIVGRRNIYRPNVRAVPYLTALRRSLKAHCLPKHRA